jgi:hypothetical protein
MVRATIKMLIPSKRRGEALGILRLLAEKSGFERGCISCRVYQGVEVEAGEGRLLECLQKNDARVSNRCKQARKDVVMK